MQISRFRNFWRSSDLSILQRSMRLGKTPLFGGKRHPYWFWPESKFYASSSFSHYSSFLPLDHLNFKSRENFSINISTKINHDKIVQVAKTWFAGNWKSSWWKGKYLKISIFIASNLSWNARSWIWLLTTLKCFLFHFEI